MTDPIEGAEQDVLVFQAGAGLQLSSAPTWWLWNMFSTWTSSFVQLSHSYHEMEMWSDFCVRIGKKDCWQGSISSPAKMSCLDTKTIWQYPSSECSKSSDYHLLLFGGSH